jgi:hypothetical protein
MNAKAEDFFPFSITKVRQVHLTINERFYNNQENAKVILGMSQTTATSVENNLLDFTLFIFLHYEGTPVPEGILADIKVQNIFHIPDIHRLKGEDGTFIPDAILIPVVSMAISHTRALFCQALAGTVYDGIIIPITNPIDAANYLFPKKEPPTEEAPAKKKATKKAAKT